MLELILKTESKVLTTNLKNFEEQANQYLATLTSTFETDDDFAKAKEEVKELKEIEDKIRNAIKQTQNGEIAELIATAESIAERFRQERLERDKLVKAKETEIKKQIADKAIEKIAETRNKLVKLSDISLALEITMPKHSIAKRIEEAQKNKRTIDSLTKAVNAEEASIISEMSAEIGRLTERLDQINAKSAYLFPDAVKLIAAQDDLAPIIQQRIAEEEQREAEIKAKAEQEAKAKAEAEKIQAESKAIADEMDTKQAVENSQNFAKTETTEPLEDFVITVRLNQSTQSNAVIIARELKAKLGDCVSLNKAK
ncbi:hypothetical protein X781_8350 [Mannheimia sp. USDA-ARS-USMARC-1261]|uniref:hypothetical protein n=1 Tax=Mannheimia sp. USDA-ARS-USMARC-1261 TaxID=1432056 RepID=UPI0003E3EBD5|nr:hypothetical protein [Mannheimia sp. USDA-ARS-USMARC-1261]AHG72983.1 hypothetical protein X781_8350 [Mannheimia sp. USDA-ARS-USMARC-1261]